MSEPPFCLFVCCFVLVLLLLLFLFLFLFVLSDMLKRTVSYHSCPDLVKLINFHMLSSYSAN